jgi:hypothetical protein
LPGVLLTGDREGRGGIVGISLGKLVCTDSDSGAAPELFSDEGDGVAVSGLTVVSLTSLTGTVVVLLVETELEVEVELLKERPGVVGVLGVLGGTLAGPPVLPPCSVSEGSVVLSSLRESSSNTDFLERSC